MCPSVRCPEGWGQPQASPRTPCAGFASMFPRWPPSEVFLPAPCTPSPAMGGGDPATWRGDQRPHSDFPPPRCLSPAPLRVSLGKFRGSRTIWEGGEEPTGMEPLVCASLWDTGEGAHPTPPHPGRRESQPHCPAAPRHPATAAGGSRGLCVTWEGGDSLSRVTAGRLAIMGFPNASFQARRGGRGRGRRC